MGIENGRNVYSRMFYIFKVELLLIWNDVKIPFQKSMHAECCKYMLFIVNFFF